MELSKHEQDVVAVWKLLVRVRTYVDVLHVVLRNRLQGQFYLKLADKPSPDSLSHPTGALTVFDTLLQVIEPCGGYLVFEGHVFMLRMARCQHPRVQVGHKLLCYIPKILLIVGVKNQFSVVGNRSERRISSAEIF